MPYKGNVEAGGFLHAPLRDCVGLLEPERTGESPGWPQGAPPSKADSALGHLPSPSPATSPLAPRAQRRDSDRCSAAGRFEASGRGGCNPTNRRNCGGSRPERLRSGSGARPEERASRSAPGSSASARNRRSRSCSSWGPRRGTVGAAWL